MSVGSSPAASQVICSKPGPVFERARPVTVPRGVGVGSCGGSRTGSDVGVGVDCWFWPHAGNPRPVARFQGLCACCPRAGSAPEVGEEGRCAVAVSLLPCPVARAVARVSWTPGGELRACNWRYSSLRMWGAAFRCHSLAQAARPSRAKRRNTTVALRADPVAIRDLAGAAPFKRCGRRVAGLGMARNPLGWQEGLDCRGL